MFPDDPGEAGLVASQSYWDRTPYVEVDDATGQVAYVEHHRTLGDWVALLAGHGFVITDLLEPEWPEGHDRIWGGWSRRARAATRPGTAIFGASRGWLSRALVQDSTGGPTPFRWLGGRLADAGRGPRFWLASARRSIPRSCQRSSRT